VLWTAIKALQKSMPNYRIYVYSWKNDNVIQKIEDQFQLDIDPNNVKFIYIEKWTWLEAKRYKRFTLIAQSLGSVVTAIECVRKFTPEIYIGILLYIYITTDTLGHAFTYPIAKIAGSKVVAYVHYPTIRYPTL
jgi:alpha-1,2-mannosyltransferase